MKVGGWERPRTAVIIGHPAAPPTTTTRAKNPSPPPPHTPTACPISRSVSSLRCAFLHSCNLHMCARACSDIFRAVRQATKSERTPPSGGCGATLLNNEDPLLGGCLHSTWWGAGVACHLDRAPSVGPNAVVKYT